MQKKTGPDPTIFTTSFKKRRFYCFSSRYSYVYVSRNQYVYIYMYMYKFLCIRFFILYIPLVSKNGDSTVFQAGIHTFMSLGINMYIYICIYIYVYIYVFGYTIIYTIYTTSFKKRRFYCFSSRLLVHVYVSMYIYIYST
jgi:hypothetical protein